MTKYIVAAIAVALAVSGSAFAMGGAGTGLSQSSMQTHEDVRPYGQAQVAPGYGQSDEQPVQAPRHHRHRR